MYIWDKYIKIKEENDKYDKIKSFLAKKEYIIKEIPFLNYREKIKILDIIEKMKYEIQIYDIIEESFCIYIVIDSDNESSEKFNHKYENLKNSNLTLEIVPQGHAAYSNFSEVKRFYDVGENRVFKIDAQQFGLGSSFILEIDQDFSLPFKKALITCNHVLNDEYFSNHNNIYIKNQYNKDFTINLDNSNIYTLSKCNFDYDGNIIKGKRNIFSESFNFDYTCIELSKNDFKEIKSYKIDKNFINNIKNNKEDFIEKEEIYLLHYSKGLDLSFSLGKILYIKNQNLRHSSPTNRGASGSPILHRKTNNIIGLHCGSWGNLNYGFFIDDILSNIQHMYNRIDMILPIVKGLKERDLIRVNHYSYKKKMEEPIKEGKCGKIYLGLNKNNQKDVLMIEINLLEYINLKTMHFNYYSLTEHIITEFERDIKIIKQLNPKTFLDAYIECNCIYIIIENNCDTKYDKYFIFNLNDIDINEIKNLLKELNEEVNILKEFFYYLGTINEHNILINIREKKYMFLFYYDKLFNGEEYETRMNQEYSDLIDIGNFLDNLLKKIIKNINSVNPMNDFGGMNLSFSTIHINPMKFGYGYKNDVETYSFFLSKIIEKINNSMLWDNYYMECKYNILNGRQKKSICNIVINNKKSTGFFCQIFDKEIPFKKALITKNIGELPDILNLKY